MVIEKIVDRIRPIKRESLKKILQYKLKLQLLMKVVFELLFQ